MRDFANARSFAKAPGAAGRAFGEVPVSQVVGAWSAAEAAPKDAAAMPSASVALIPQSRAGRVLAALHPEGKPVPKPILQQEEDAAPLDAPFRRMARIAGRIFTDHAAPPADPAELQALQGASRMRGRRCTRRGPMRRISAISTARGMASRAGPSAGADGGGTASADGSSISTGFTAGLKTDMAPGLDLDARSPPDEDEVVARCKAASPGASPTTRFRKAFARLRLAAVRVASQAGFARATPPERTRPPPATWRRRSPAAGVEAIHGAHAP